ncbi:MAG: alginate lyase family protein, partial [Candidatus Acidiferrum sp.]
CISRSADFIANHLSVYFAPNTHLLAEGFALFIVGALFPELKGAQGWYDLGQHILTEEMQKQVREDGSHFEQSLFYHRYASEFFLCALILAKRNNIAFPPSYAARLERMLEYLLFTAWPSGMHPSVGDSDGGRLIPFGAFDATDHRPVLSTAAVYFARGDFKKASGEYHEQTLWLLGRASLTTHAGLTEELPNETSRAFSDSGIVTLRSDWGDRAKFLLFDAGSQGMGLSGHGHSDSLSLLCAANGVEWLVDPGTYVYSSSREWRNFFRSTCAHNTISLDGLNQAEEVDWFKWRKLPRVRLQTEFLHPAADFVIGSHDGYERLAQPVNHRRKVVFIKPDYWLISDELAGTGQHLVRAFFHFGPDIALQPYKQAWLATKGRESFLLWPLRSGLRFDVIRGDASSLQGWVSSDYGHKEPASVLVGEVDEHLPLQFHWLLVPVSSPEEMPDVLESPSDGVSFSVRTERWVDFVEAHGWSKLDTNTNLPPEACLSIVRRDSQGRIKRVVLFNGNPVEEDELSVSRVEYPFSYFVADWEDDSLKIEANPVPEFRIQTARVKHLSVNGRIRDLSHETSILIPREK